MSDDMKIVVNVKGREFFTNREGCHVFTHNLSDHCHMQIAATNKFKTESALRSYIRRNFLTE